MTRHLSLILLFVSIFLAFPSSGFSIKEGYYHLGHEILEFRLAIETLKEADESGNKDWKELSDLNGKNYFVSPEVEIGSGDIDSILVEKEPFDDVSYHIIIYFKKEAWGKVRDVTGRNVKRRLGIFRGNRLLGAPVIQEALENQANVVGLTNSTIDWFVTGFILAVQPDEEKLKREKRKEDYTDYLAKEAEKNPIDIDLQIRLASRYMFDSPKDYRKAADLFEGIIRQKPSRSDIVGLLAECYTSLGEFQKAIDMLNDYLVTKPEDELITRIQLAEAYQKSGQHAMAIKQLEQALDVLNTSSEQNSESWRDAIKKEIAKIKTDMESPAHY